MKPVLRSASLAFGLTTLYLLNLTGPLISPDHDLVFHFPGRALSLFAPVLLDMLVVWLILTGVLHVARTRRAQLLLWTALIFPVPAILLTTIADFTGKRVPPVLVTAAAYLPLVAFVLVLIFQRRLAPFFRRAKPVLETVFGVIAFSGLIIVVELLWFGFQARDSNAPPALHQASASAMGQPRIIWILLDELSYEQVYEHRFPGLNLPAFDRLAAQSTVFTQVAPANEFTRVAVPSLLSGHDLEDTRQSSDGRRIAMQDDENEKWSRLEPEDTVFADALGAGYRTGVAGWHEPYCRLFAPALDRCFWTYGDSIPGDISGRRSAMANVVHSLGDLGLRAVKTLRLQSSSAETDEGRADVRGHYADYHALYVAGDEVLSDPRTSFVYLHLPIPHPWGFYDRRTGTFPDHRTSYIDNLALADLYLAHVRELLEKQNQWDSSTVIVMGDHSWRSSFVWSKSPHWEAEEELASRHADYDERPAYVVKLPNQQTSTRVDATFEASHTRLLVDGLLHHQIQTPAELATFVDEQK